MTQKPLKSKSSASSKSAAQKRPTAPKRPKTGAARALPFAPKEIRAYNRNIEERMAAKVLRGGTATKKFKIAEIHSAGKNRLANEEAERERKKAKAKRQSSARDGMENSLKTAEKRLRDAEGL